MINLPYRLAAGAALVLALFGVGYFAGYRHEHAAWAADVAKRNAAESAAILARNDENAKLAAQQSATNAAITKAYDEELASVRSQLATAQRMRKPAFCGGSTDAAQAQSSGSGNAPDPAGRVLPEQVERNIRALILETEEATATARACQSFIRENGME